MLPRERLEIIKQIAREDKRVYVTRLSKKFNVTEETIRRDLDKLENLGIVTRSYGGAILNIENTNENRFFHGKLGENLENEKYIVEKAAEIIKEGSTIIADSSILALKVLKFVRDRQDLTVVTNSVEVLKELSQTNLNLISTGGIVNKNGQSLQGSIAQEVIKNYNVDIAFINCSGIDLNKGILDLDETEAEIKKKMIRQAKEVVLLADNTKFDKRSLVKLFEYDEIDCIVTNEEPKEEWMKLFKSHNIKVIH